MYLPQRGAGWLGCRAAQGWSCWATPAWASRPSSGSSFSGSSRSALFAMKTGSPVQYNLCLRRNPNQQLRISTAKSSPSGSRSCWWSSWTQPEGIRSGPEIVYTTVQCSILNKPVSRFRDMSIVVYIMLIL